MILVGLMASAIGGIFVHDSSTNKDTLEVVKKHIESSDRTLRTIEFRQRLVMERLNIPGYADPIR